MNAHCPACFPNAIPLLRGHFQASLKALCSQCKRWWLVVGGTLVQLEHTYHEASVTTDLDKTKADYHEKYLELIKTGNSGLFGTVMPAHDLVSFTVEAHDGTHYSRITRVSPHELWKNLPLESPVLVVLALDGDEVLPRPAAILTQQHELVLKEVQRPLLYSQWVQILQLFNLSVVLWLLMIAFSGKSPLAPYLLLIPVLTSIIPLILLLKRRPKDPIATPTPNAKPTVIQQIEGEVRRLRQAMSAVMAETKRWQARLGESQALSLQMSEHADIYAGQLQTLELKQKQMQAALVQEHEHYALLQQQIELLDIERHKFIVSGHHDLLESPELQMRLLSAQDAEKAYATQRRRISAESELSSQLGSL